MQGSSNLPTDTHPDDCLNADDPAGAWLRITIRGNDEACHVDHRTNDSLDLGYPNLDAAWARTYTRGPLGESALAQALREAGATRTGASGVRVTVTANGRTVTDQAAAGGSAGSAGPSTSSHRSPGDALGSSCGPAGNTTDGGVTHAVG